MSDWKNALFNLLPLDNIETIHNMLGRIFRRENFVAVMAQLPSTRNPVLNTNHHKIWFSLKYFVP